jgi:hypothetical protein
VQVFDYKKPVRLNEVLILLALVLSLFAYCYSISTISSRMMQSYHGLYHSAYIYQVFNGIVPPTNPQVIGEASSRYWPWHASIAALMHVFRTDPFTTVVLVNCFSLSVSAALLYRLCRRLGHGTMYALLGAALFTSILSFSADIYRLAHGLALPSRVPAPDRIYSFIESLFGARVDVRFGSMLQKFLNQNSFPTTVALFMALFYIDWKARLEKGRARKWPLFIAELLLAALLGLFHPVTLLFFDLWVAASSLADLAEERPASFGKALGFVRGKAARYLPLLIAHALILPYLLHVTSQYGGGVAFQAGLRSIFEQVGRTGPVFWIWAAVIILARLRYGRFAGRREMKLFYILSALALACVLFVRLPDHNEYKFALLATVPLSVLLSGMAAHAEGALVRRAAVTLLGLAVAGQLLSTAHSRLTSPWANEDPFVFQGTEVRLNPVSEKAAALQEASDWIKRNTPAASYIVTEPTQRDRMLLPTIAERRVFVARPSLETAGVEDFDAVFSLNGHLLSRARAEKSVYLLDDEPAFFKMRALTERLDEVYLLAENDGAQGPTAVFSNGHFVLHRLQVMSRQPKEAGNGP